MKATAKFQNMIASLRYKKQTISLCSNLLETINGYINLILSESLTFY